MNGCQIATGMVVALLMVILPCPSNAGSPGPGNCMMQGQLPICTQPQRASQPECGLEITCTDQPVMLGYRGGVCFRATCPGIWSIMHTRMDQASFRKRFFTYRHYSFRGQWELKDQGTIEVGPATVRELFLVLPDDLIELKLADPDPNARIEVRNLGYIKKGTVAELQQWLAYQAYMESFEATPPQSTQRTHDPAAASRSASNGCYRQGILSGVLSAGRNLGLPLSAPQDRLLR